jgi:catechol 2,3-dioxygenase-like lactoylglutathione lyase family enzyme
VERIVAARYTNIEATPAQTLGSEPGTGDYLRAFFSPQGMDALSTPRAEGPSKPLPPPPFREKVPHIHTGALGEGGPTAEVEDGFAVAEAEDLTTAVLLEGAPVPLGRAVRLLVPEGAEVVLRAPDGRTVELEGPLDVSLR